MKIVLIFLFNTIEFLLILCQLKSLCINNGFYGRFSSLESPTTIEGSFEVASVPFFIPDFNLLSYEFDNFTLKVLY